MDIIALSMNKIESIAYDLEGTIVDIELVHHNSDILAAKDFGVELSLEDCFAKLPHFIGGPGDKVAKEISDLSELQYGKLINYSDFKAVKKEHYQRLLKEAVIEPRAGFIDFFYAAKDMRLKYTIGSLTGKDEALFLLEQSGLMNLFGRENIVLREDVKEVKPAPDVWIETARRASVDPSSQIVFEDSPRGIEGAVKVNAYGIGIPVYFAGMPDKSKADQVNALIDAGAKMVFPEWGMINPEYLINYITKPHQEQ
jgi:HAD superfamily hydrolase (TIGR01509 family)